MNFLLACVSISWNGCSINELEKFQQFYADRGIAIVVFDKDTFGSGESPFFDGRARLEGAEIEMRGIINLCYDARKKHFDTILNLTGVAKTKFFCCLCNKRYHHIEQHRCAKICLSCSVSPFCETRSIDFDKCAQCNRDFFGVSCYENHKKGGSHKKKGQVCAIVKVCGNCAKVVNRNRGKHVCGINWCSLCRKKHPINSMCYMQPIRTDEQQRAKKFLFVFYDFETRQDEAFRNHTTTTEHIPNLCVAQHVCSDCLDVTDISQWCDTCGIREHVFREEPVKALLEMYLREKSEYKQIICIAHNAGGFDAQFILKEMTDGADRGSAPSIILNEQNIITLEHGLTKFIDSLNYFHMKLRTLPATFNLSPITKKGFLPHLFNKVENQSNVGPLPDARFYDPDSMSESERKSFLLWYAENSPHLVFDFRKEIV